MFEYLIHQHQLFLLIFARIAALFMASPILSSTSIPPIAKGGLMVFTSIVVLPMVSTLNYPVPGSGILYAYYLVMEVLIGLVMALILNLVFAGAQIAGQVFSIQMGFGASTTYDPMSQVQIPLIGQFYYLIAIMVFVTVGGMKKIFFTGIFQSFKAMKGADIMLYPDFLQDMFITGLGRLFGQALVISFPVISTLLLISLTMGLLAKAAPQMNLLMIGFPIKIMVGFLMIYLSAGFLVRKLEILFDWGFELFRVVWTKYGGTI